MTPWHPDWEDTPAPAGDDEPEAKALYERVILDGAPWEQLDEWKRESWRREIRDE